MYRVILLPLFLISSFLSACSSIPDPEDIPSVDAYDIITRLRCEVREALELDYSPHHPIQRATIGYGLTLTTVENRAKTAQILGTWPIHLGTFSLQGDAGIARTNTGESKIDFAETISKPTQKECIGEETTKTAALYPVTGNIGMRKIIERFVRINNIGGSFTPKTGFVDTKTFSLKFNGGIKPSFSIAEPSGRKVSGNINLTADRKDEHKLTIVITPYKKPSGPDVLNIHITNWKDAPSGGGVNFKSQGKEGKNSRARTFRDNRDDVLRKLKQERIDQEEEDIRDFILRNR